MAAKNAQKEESFDEKVLFVNRCAKVVKGGRKFSFSALILVGDKNREKRRAGFGFGKANELSDAIKKGGEAARKNVLHFELEGDTIPHEVFVTYEGAKLLLKPAPPGTGIIAGPRIRAILEFAGVKDVVAKSMGSNNPINQVKAAFYALTSLESKERVQEMRGAGG
jgi:small subunit ribosomal protein S5